MTIEEKAKAYDEALKKAKTYHDYQIEIINDIFPELKESKDDKIRKEILSNVTKAEDSLYVVFTPQKRKEWIAWLEKQKPLYEQDTRHKYLDELLAADDTYQMAVNDAMVEEAKLKAITALSKMEISKLLVPKKQKTVEWSEEDETRLINIIIMLKEGASIHFNKDDITKGVAWLKSLYPPYYCDNCKLKKSFHVEKMTRCNPTVKGWVARDKGGRLSFYTEMPKRSEECKFWMKTNGDTIELKEEIFPGLKYENNPIEVELTINKI